MKKKLWTLAILVGISLTVSGCLGFDSGKKPSGNLTVSGKVYLSQDTQGTIKVPLGNATVDIPGVGTAKTDASGVYSITGLSQGTYTIRGIAPIGSREFSLPISKSRNDVDIYILSPEFSEFAWSTFCEVSGINQGVQRWPDGHNLTYHLEPDATNQELQLIRNAFSLWDNAIPDSVLNIFEVSNPNNADITVIWADSVEYDGKEVVSYAAVQADTKDVIKRVEIYISRKYSDSQLPYHIAVAEALGLKETEHDPSSILYSDADVSNPNVMNKTPTEADLNYARAVYSMAPGTKISCTF